MRTPIQPVKFEEWKYITSLSVPNVREKVYLISNFGRVWSTLTNRLLTLTETWNGYFRVCLQLNDGSGHYYLIHRIVLIEFNCCENYEHLQVNHKDCDKSNNDDDNLEWMTCSENIIHAYRNGAKVAAKGDQCSFATITNEQADKIGQLLSERKLSHKQIAEITGTKKHIVGNISTGTTWNDIYKKYNLDRFQKEWKIRFTDEQLHLLCEYFEQNIHKYSKNVDLFKDALMDLFGIQYENSMSATMSRIFNHKTRKEITDKYNF